MSTNPDLSQYASLIASMRWKNTTPEQRKAATAKAREARKAKAAERREAQNGGTQND